MKKLLCYLGIHHYYYADAPLYEGEIYMKMCHRCAKHKELTREEYYKLDMEEKPLGMSTITITTDGWVSVEKCWLTDDGEASEEIALGDLNVDVEIIDEREAEEIPQMKGTMELLDNI